ncbi:MAG TPA: T9SS type A sorting domain-containing protein [Bacteroidia bacterium]
MKKISILISVVILSFLSQQAHALPPGDTVMFSALGHFNFSFTYSAYTPVIDRLGRPYVYLATKELGLVTMNISNTSNPIPVDTQTVASLGNLKVTGVAQDSNYLLVSLGDFQGTTQNAGLAIFDISNPANPVLLDRWDTAAFTKGTSTVIWQGNYAYLGAMQKGVVILDISNRHNIRFVSQIIPDTTFGSHSYVYHSRGLYLSHDTLLVADDNGGLRVINVANKQNPVEIGKFMSSAIPPVAAAYYNHVYRIGNYAYCAMDFCGVEVVNVSNPSAMSESAWLNPWNCTSSPPPFGSWNGSNGHCNEIAYAPLQNILMFSGGDSQVLAIDPSDPFHPRIAGEWGPPKDSIGSWGVDVFGNLVAIANIHTPGFPFVSTKGGLQLLSWQAALGVEENSDRKSNATIFPNPFSTSATLKTNEILQNATIKVYNSFGKQVNQLNNVSGQAITIRRSELPSGIYFLQIIQKNKIIAEGKIIISD